MADPAKEKRKTSRVRHDSVLELYDETGRLLAGALKLVDLSSSGASFSTTQAFSKGARIRGRLRLPDVGILEITGRIVRFKERTNATVYAVEFDSVRQRRR